MIVAAGFAANLANPFNAVTTVTVQIVGLLTGDQEFDSPAICICTSFCSFSYFNIEYYLSIS